MNERTNTPTQNKNKNNNKMSFLESVPTAGKSIKSFTDELVKGKNDVPKVLGKPSFTTVKPVLDAVDTNLIAMLDPRDPQYGKLHLVEDTSILPNGPAQQIVPSADQGKPIPYTHPTTVRQRQNYLHDFREDQENWLDDQNAEESLKLFILSRMDEVYFDDLKEPIFEYKGVTLCDFMDLLIDDF